MVDKVTTRLTIAALLLTMHVAAAQQVSWEQEWGKRLKAASNVPALDTSLMGEQVSLYDGSTTFIGSDVDLPGNASIPMKIGRRIALADPSTLMQDELFGDWALEIPNIRGVYDSPTAFVGCNALGSATYGAPELYAPGGGGGMLLTRLVSPKAPQPAIANLSGATTKSRWYFQCINAVASGQTAEGFLGLSPDGLRYRFDWMTSHRYPGVAVAGAFSNQVLLPRYHNRLYPTEVADRFGNWVRYQWSGRQLLAVTSSDGRRIDLSYVPGTDRISAITANGKTWQYSYATRMLSGVTLPDGSRWTYADAVPVNVELTDLTETYDCNSSTCKSRPKMDRSLMCAFAPLLKNVTHDFVATSPSGATGRFTFRPLRHGRTNVPLDCLDTGHNAYQPYHDTQSLVAKQLSGPGLNPMTWTYAYGNVSSGYAAAGGSTPHYKTTTVNNPDGSVEVQSFGKDYAANDGQLARSEVLKEGVTQRSVAYTYVTNAQAASMPFDAAVGNALVDDTQEDVWGATALRPQLTTYTMQNGDVFRRDVLAFDPFGRPLQVKSYSGQP